MSFSTVLRLNDVDDYIAPSQTCIKPITLEKNAGRTKSIKIEQDGTYTATLENGSQTVLKNAEIKLDDCLACSGCITTSETVLLSQHSLTMLVDVLRTNRLSQNPRIVVASISPQSIASIASNLCSVPCLNKAYETFCNRAVEPTTRFSSVFNFVLFLLLQSGFHLILNTTWARDVALMEGTEEFIMRWKKHAHGDNSPSKFYLPLLASVCPGWICYAEKSSGNKILPDREQTKFSLITHLSTIRSPQQLLGYSVKRASYNYKPGDIFHVCVMPCFDKKLEATRSEFAFTHVEEESQSSEQDIDLVLATNEFMNFLQSITEKETDEKIEHVEELSLSQHRNSIIEKLRDLFGVEAYKHPEGQAVYRHVGSGSGGYSLSILRAAAIQLFALTLEDNPVDDGRLLIRQLANKDLQEFALFANQKECHIITKLLESSYTQGMTSQKMPLRHFLSRCDDGSHMCRIQTDSQPSLMPKPLLVFAVCNGFRNIQNLLTQLKTAYRYSGQSAVSLTAKNCFPYDYVEVMACPGGCLNGGGQLKGSLVDSTAIYNSLPIQHPMSSEHSHRLRDHLAASGEDKTGVHTSFREVPHMEIINPAALLW